MCNLTLLSLVLSIATGAYVYVLLSHGTKEWNVSNEHCERRVARVGMTTQRAVPALCF